MFGLFKRHKWIHETVPQSSGSYHGLSVTVRNLPCLREELTGARKYSYPDFGNDFLVTLHKHLGDFEVLRSKLDCGAACEVLVSLPSCPPILVELRGVADRSRRTFDSDLADALIEAFKSAKLRASWT